MTATTLRISDTLTLANDRPFALIAGPCIIESEALTLEIAGRLCEITSRLSLPFIFKASYDKANRSSIGSYRGPGLEKGLEVLAKVRQKYGVPVLTDVHAAEEASAAAKIVDVLQIPAFLCRQTDLIVAAARTGKPVNVKKGQFLAPEDMKNIVEKCKKGGNAQVILTERGSSFGYHNLVVDMRGLDVMKHTGCPVVFDATHSVQLPGAGEKGASTGGQREFIRPLSQAAVAVGISGLFMEVHPDPAKALSDGPNSYALDDLAALLTDLQKIDAVVKGKDFGGSK